MKLENGAVYVRVLGRRRGGGSGVGGLGGWECIRGDGTLPARKPLKDTCGQKGILNRLCMEAGYEKAFLEDC